MSKKYKNKKKHSEEEGGEAWLLPYSDLMTLLLAVFIVLFAVSKIDESKAEKMADAFRSGMMTGSESVLSGEGDSVIPLNPEELQEEIQQDESNAQSETEVETTQEETDVSKEDANILQEDTENFLGKDELEILKELKTEFDVISHNEELTADMTTSIDTRGLVISLNNAVLFDSGSAEIKIENEDTFFKIAQIINKLDNYIRIEGHTDNIPMHTSAFPSNWELSTARAASVVRLFIDEYNVLPEKVVVVGYGENKPIADNSTVEGRAKNRRIDIIVLSEKYNNLEKQITK